MPAFMAERWIGRAIESLRSQRFQRWELLVVEDGSSDATGAIARAYADADPRISVRAQPNAGTSAARNAAIAVAQGELVAYLDADDELLPDHLDVRVAALSAGYDFVFGPVLVAEGERREVFRGRLDGGDEDCVMPLMVMHRRRCFAAGLFEPSLVFEEDLELWYRMVASFRVLDMNGPVTAVYHVHAEAMHRLHEQGGDEAVLAFRARNRRSLHEVRRCSS
jgi:glycosyltransferase involved in cell wall biosynthesis